MIASRISACTVSAAFAVGLMLSPDALMLHGNSAGYAGEWILWITALVFFFHCCNIVGYSQVFDRYPGPQAELALIKEAWGALPALLIPLASRFILFACMATGLLVTAGFVFNEVFLYWFPNFGFAALLLVVLLIVNLLGRRVTLWSQVVFTATAFLCLLVLCVAGYAVGGPEKVLTVADPTGVQIPSAILMCLLVFIGYDLAGFVRREHDRDSVYTRFAMLAGITVVFILFLLWNRLSITYVSLERLSETTIPHILVAKAILGQTGRVLIGLAAISGTCAAVNALLYCTSQMIGSMVRLELVPSFAARRFARVPIALVLLALCPGVMMALGLAGTPELDIFVRAGLWFWLLGYGVVHLSLIVLQKHKVKKNHCANLALYRFLSAMIVSVIAAALCAMFVYYEAPLLLLKYLIWIGLGALIISMVSIRLRKATG
jgi:amino acid transporter